MNTTTTAIHRFPGVRGRVRWLAAAALTLGAVFWQGQAEAGGRSDQIAGAIIGAGFGAVIGQHMGGHDGAIIGGAIGAATGAAAAGGHGHRVYRTHDRAPRVHGGHHAPQHRARGYGRSGHGGHGASRGHGGHYRGGPGARPGHAPWVGTLAAPQVVIVNPPRGYVQRHAPRVHYHAPRPHVRGHRHGVVRGNHGRAVVRAYRQGVRDGARLRHGHRY